MTQEELEDKVREHDGNLSYQLTDMVTLGRRLSELEKENAELKRALAKTVILAQRIFVLIPTDKLSNEGARRSSEIVGMLRELHDQFGITGSNPEAD
jgi:hypothetical protein